MGLLVRCAEPRPRARARCSCSPVNSARASEAGGWIGGHSPPPATACFIHRAGVVTAIDRERAGAQEHFPLLSRVAAKSLLLPGGLPEAQGVIGAGVQARETKGPKAPV